MMEIQPPQRNPIGETARLVRGLSTLPRLALRTPQMQTRRPKTVVVLPGFLTGDGSTVALRGFLRAIGHQPVAWGIGRNHGNVQRLLPRVAALIDHTATRVGGPVVVLGWSLGGVLAREATRWAPQHVSEIVTMGTPVVGGPKYTAAASYYTSRGIDLDAVAAKAAERNASRLSVPVTALYSRADAVVAWQACLDPNPDNDVQHIEVGAGHAEMGFSAEVFRIIADQLESA